MSKSVNVVLLAGGYSAAVAKGAASAAAASTTRDITPRQMMAEKAAGNTPRKLGKALAAVASGSIGGSAVPVALVPLDGVPAVVRILQLLQTVRRVSLESVWVVHNEGDKARLRGPGGLFGEQQRSDLGLPEINFLSNGATGPHDWRGEVADLRLALGAMGAAAGVAGGVAAVSCELAFMPGYNMQRLLEHSYLRGRDVVGSSLLNGVDVALVGEEGHTVVVPAEDNPLPRLEQLIPHSTCEPGNVVAEPFLFLRPDSAAAVAGGAGGAVGTLPELAAALIAGGGYVAAIDLMFGRYALRTAQAVDYVDQFFTFVAAATLDPSLVGMTRDQVLQPYDTSGLAASAMPRDPQPPAGASTGRSTAAMFQFDQLNGPADTGRSSAASNDYDAFLKMCNAFHRTFFGEAASGTPSGMKQYLLPSTFYMTAYRRQAADILR